MKEISLIWDSYPNKKTVFHILNQPYMRPDDQHEGQPTEQPWSVPFNESKQSSIWQQNEK